MINKSVDDYLEFMIHVFYNDLVTLQELKGLSDDELETLYGLGYNLFTYGKYEKAKGIFVGLTAYSPYTAHYWRALGAVNQQLEEYEEGIEGYDMAIANDPDDIVSYVYRAESKLLLGNVEGALEDFEKVIKFEDFNKFKPWIERAKLLLIIHNKSK